MFDLLVLMYQVVTQLMDKLFNTRRNALKRIDNANKRVNEALKEYPCLKWQSEVMHCALTYINFYF